MNNRDYTAVTEIAYRYFDGLHNADIDNLRQIFHRDCFLKSPGIRRSLEEWFELISNRPVPNLRGDPFNYQILEVQVFGDQAMLRVYCPLLGSTFIDFLGLLKENGDWLIVNKMYAEIPNLVGDIINDKN